MADLAQAVMWHRQVAALAAAADRAGVAEADLPALRSRLTAQQSRLTDAAARGGAAMPALIPSPSEIASAGPALGNLGTEAVARAVRSMMSTLDAVDAALGVPAPAPTGAHTVGTLVAPPPPLPPPAPVSGPATQPQSVEGLPGRSPALRNAAIYGGFAVTVLAAQIVMFVFLDEQTALPLSAPLCLVILPLLAWLGGFLTITLVFPSVPGGPPAKRSPRLGAFICLIPDLLLCAVVGALFVANRS